MEKWSFNSLLFSRLSDVLDISGTEIAKRCGLTQQVFSRYTTNETVVSVQVLIRICNSLRMPIRFFISEDNNHIIPNRETATVAADYWQPVGWDSQAVEKSFGDGEGRVYWKDVADAMGVTSQKPHERFLLNTRFPVTHFLAVCSRFGISPFRFLIDKNDCRSGGTGMKSEVSALRRKVADLEAAVADLTLKYDRLIADMEKLASRTGAVVTGFAADTPAPPADD